MREILKKIRPTRQEEELIARLSNRLISIANELGYDCLIVGSIGKLTWLRGDHDIDLFILFPKSFSREQLEKSGLEIGKKIAEKMNAKWKVKYAEHPYTQMKVKFEKEYYNVDIVPCYKISKGENIISAVDRSPHHLSYVLKNLNPALRDEVRLLKQFMKGIGVYGSDAKTLGFSGYICELLVMTYGKFEDVLKAASNWKAGEIINAELAKKKFHDPLVIIDPTDTKRNAAAALSSENLFKFINAARNYLKSPDEKYFFAKDVPLKMDEIKKLKNRGTKFLAMVFSKPDIIDDVLYPQLRRAMRRIKTLLHQEEFVVLRNYEFANHHAVLIFEFEIWNLPKIKRMVGPPVFSRKHSDEFLKKYSSYRPIIDGDRWVVEKNREFLTCSDLIRSFIKRSEDDLIKNGIPKNIACMMRNARVLEHEEFWKYIEKNKQLSIFLRKKYFGD